MIFEDTPIAGVRLVRVERRSDERGFFARTWCAEELAAHGCEPGLAQASVSWNRLRGTLRGMHYQAAPFEEAKLVACLRGAIFDVVADLREGSPTRHAWWAVRLDGGALDMLYVPPGVAHGFLTLADDTLVHYSISMPYRPEAARGVRYDDPALGIAWPEPPAVVSERDLAFPPLGGVRR